MQKMKVKLKKIETVRAWVDAKYAPLHFRSRTMTETDGFVRVTYRRHRNRRKYLRNEAFWDHLWSNQNCEADCDSLLHTLDNTLAEIKDTSFAKSAFQNLTDSLTVLNTNGISEIVCYGLGPFSKYHVSRHQLAFLLCLKAQYNAHVYIYDPVFSPKEVQVLRTLGLEIIETNESGKRVVRDKTTTLIYMPHCPLILTNNFLSANWGDRLNNCILLTNSFSQIANDVWDKSLLKSIDYILRIEPYVTEVQLGNICEYEEAFSNLKIHIFAKDNLHKVPTNFWNFRE